MKYFFLLLGMSAYNTLLYEQHNTHDNVFQIPTYCTIYLLDKTHVKIRTSNPLKNFFNITLLHVSIFPDHHQGVNVPIYEVIEYLYICWCYWYDGGMPVIVIDDYKFLDLFFNFIFGQCIYDLSKFLLTCGCVGYVVFSWSDRCLSCVVMRVVIRDYHVVALWFVWCQKVCCVRMVVALWLADLFGGILEYTWLPNCSCVYLLYMF